MIVAIDGPAGSGKSTTARRVAAQLDYLYLDTGAMYRAVALAFLRTEREPTPAEAAALLPTLRVDVDHTDAGMRVRLNGEDATEQIRRSDVSAMASRVSALPVVREKLVAEQRRIARAYAAQGGGVVLDGRDIGTVVFPDADVKIFMVADAEERARRRHAELKQRGEAVAFEDVLAEIKRRDRQDTERQHAPLRQAEDAIAIDTTQHSVASQVQQVITYIRERQEAPSR